MRVAGIVRWVCAIGCICGLLWAVYGQVLSAPFIWDDEALVLKNRLIRSTASVPDVFTKEFFDKTVEGSNFYRPLQTLTLMMDYHSWRLDPSGYRATNIILHCAASVMVMVLLFQLFASLRTAFFGALLFALHPIHTESVTYISGRAEPLMAALLLAALCMFIAALRASGRNSLILIFVSGLCFSAALLSKELAVIFPLLAAVYCACFRETCRGRKRTIAYAFGWYALLFAVYALVRVHLFSLFGFKQAALANIPFWVRVSAMPKVVYTYMSSLVYPADLHMSRQLFRPRTAVELFFWWGALSTFAYVTVRSLLATPQKKVWGFLLLFSLLFFIPQSGIFPINAIVADHFIYLSSVTFFAALAYVFLAARWKKAGTLVLIGLAGYFGCFTMARNIDWTDAGIFYRKIITLSPSSYQAHNNLGQYYQAQGDLRKAAFHYRMAGVLSPKVLEAHTNLAYVYSQLGNQKAAEEEYQTALKIAPPHLVSEVHNNLAVVYEIQGDWKKAVAHYRLALTLNPKLAFVHYNLARVFLAQGDMDSTVKEVIASLEPVTGERNKGAISSVAGDFVRAQGCSSGYAVFYSDLGVEFAGRGQLETARDIFTLALEIAPQFADLHYNRGLAHYKLGQMKDAQQDFRNALKLNPGNEKARHMLKEVMQVDPGRMK